MKNDKLKIIKISKGDGSQELTTVDELEKRIKGYYKDEKVIIEELLSGKIESLQTDFSIWELNKTK